MHFPPPPLTKTSLIDDSGTAGASTIFFSSLSPSVVLLLPLSSHLFLLLCVPTFAARILVWSIVIRVHVWHTIGQSVCCCVRVSTYLCSISARAFETGVFMFELRSGTGCVWLCAVWVCVNVCSISAQAFETGVFMFELSFSRPVAMWLLS